MKIAIIGAGAMGCLYGAYLFKNNEVVLIDSLNPQVEAINANGLIMLENGIEQTYPIKAFLSGTNIGSVDLVIVFVKSIYTYEAVEANQNLIDKHTIVMTLQNGAGNDRDIMHFVEKNRIIIGTSKHNSVSVGFGKIHHTGSGITTLGAMEQNTNIDKLIIDTLKKAGLEVEVSDDIQRIIWSKLFVNISVNTLTALTGTKNGYMIQNKDAWNFAKRIIYEAINVAEEDGTYFDRREVLEMVRHVCETVGEGYSSMYQDRKRKVRTEIDKLNGAVIEQAKLYGVATPCNSLVVDLIHAIEGTYLEAKT